MRRLQASTKAFWWTATLTATTNINDGANLLLPCSAIQEGAIREDPDKSSQLERTDIKLEGEECIPIQDNESSGRVISNKARVARSAHLAVSIDASTGPDVGILRPFKRKTEKRFSPGKMRRRRRRRLRDRPNNGVNSNNFSPDAGILESHTCEDSLGCAKDLSSSLGGRCVPKKHPYDEMDNWQDRRGLQADVCFESCPNVPFCRCIYQVDVTYDLYDSNLFEVCLPYIAAVCANEQYRDACLVGSSGEFWKNYYCDYFTCEYEGGSIQQCQCLYYCYPELCDCIQTNDFDPACVDPVAYMCKSDYTSYCSVYDYNVLEHTLCPLHTCLASGKSEAVCRCVGSKSSCNYFKLSSRQKAQYYCAVADCCSKATTDAQRSSCFFKEQIANPDILPSLPPSVERENRDPSECPPSCKEDVCDCVVSKNYSQECISLIAQECRSQSDCKQSIFGNGELSSVCIGHICTDEGGSNNECDCKQHANFCSLVMDGKMENDTVCIMADCCEKAINDEEKGMCLGVLKNHDGSNNPTPIPTSFTKYGSNAPSMSLLTQEEPTTNSTNITNKKPSSPATISAKATSSSASMCRDFPILLISALAGLYMLLFDL